MSLITTYQAFAWQMFKIDPTQDLTVSPGRFGPEVRASHPSLNVIQIIQILLKNSATPDAVIPEGLEPKDDPEKFRKLTSKEQTEILVKEIVDAVHMMESTKIRITSSEGENRAKIDELSNETAKLNPPPELLKSGDA